MRSLHKTHRMPQELINLRSANTRQKVDQRERDLCQNFASYLSYYDCHVPFTKSGQYEFHRTTIDRRNELAQVRVAVFDEQFLTDLWKTLEAWGVNSRAASLVPKEHFKKRLQEICAQLEELESLQIDNIATRESAVATQIWGAVLNLQITTSNNKVVSGTKALHHLLPDLVPPMDRQFTRSFFHWHGPQFQYRPKDVFVDIYVRFVNIAKQTNPGEYVGKQWRTSRTKILDNAVVGYCLKNNITLA